MAREHGAVVFHACMFCMPLHSWSEATGGRWGLTWYGWGCQPSILAWYELAGDNVGWRLRGW